MDGELSRVRGQSLACLKAGLVIAQINIRHDAAEAEAEAEAEFQLQDSGAAALIFDDAVAERVEQLSAAFENWTVAALEK